MSDKPTATSFSRLKKLGALYYISFLVNIPASIILIWLSIDQYSQDKFSLRMTIKMILFGISLLAIPIGNILRTTKFHVLLDMKTLGSKIFLVSIGALLLVVIFL